MSDLKDRKSESQKKSEYSDQEINEIADWLADLTLKQAFFLKESYEAMLFAQSQACKSEFLH